MMPFSLSDFDYDLPSGSIAQFPIEPRDHSRLLIMDRASGTTTHRTHFKEIINYLCDGDVLVFNDSRVIRSRLVGRFPDTGGRVELLVLRRVSPRVWQCLGKSGRRLTPGMIINFVGNGLLIEATILSKGPMGTLVVEFFQEINLQDIGSVPLPPYIRQPISDPERYQTVYSRELGSIAAPTAGLHFTHSLLNCLDRKGVELVFVTLHIGTATFRPVLVSDPYIHRLDPEYVELSQQAATAINNAKAEGRRVISVGTTSARLLEGISSRLGEKHRGNLGGRDDVSSVKPWSGWIDLMILPGYRFQVVDGLITNFHLPKSTLLMLVSAFSDRELILGAYSEAIIHGYRFYSFGDAMFLI